MAKGLLQGEIKVSTADLKAQAEKVRSNVRNMENAVNQISSIMKKSKSYWIGEAGETYRDCWTDNEQDIRDMLARLKMQPDSLEAIASNYEQGELRNVQVSNSLPDNILD